MADPVLLTPEGEALLQEPEAMPWTAYPRPSLRRDSFLCLNGLWDFAVTADEDLPVYDRQIRVPFPPESHLSGIGALFPETATLCYRRTFSLPDGFRRDRVLLHFGAVDQTAEVFLNGRRLGLHHGGYQPFSFDVTPFLQEENCLTVLVQDHLSEQVLPYGKQCHKRGGMWYTPVSGVWQTVWLESLPAVFLTDLTVETAGNAVTVLTRWSGEAPAGQVTVTTPAGLLTAPLSEGMATFTVEAPRFWSPEDPYLYDLTVTAGEDTVSSYFAFRTLSIETVGGYPRMCLNGKPYFFHGLLDQGYYSDGIFTPASPEGYERDIKAMKALGFNTLRKHIKVEPQVFYYLCDRLGMVVFQDMVNNSDYSFLRDTALPTVGLLRKNDTRTHRDPATRAAFRRHMAETVEQLRRHPSLCLWTIFNEGWGQFCGTEMRQYLKSLDDSRFIDTASGWFGGCENDLDSRHIYFRPVKLKAKDKPLYLSEFGGYVYKPNGHVFNKDKTYGYGSQPTREAFVAALTRLYRDEILPLIPRGLCATVYTQVSDVEDEVNGLLSYDRRVQKVTAEELLPLSEALCRAIEAEP